MSTTTLKHPQALASLSLCYAFFMVAVGGIISSLTLYQTNQLHMQDNLAYEVFAAAMALLWILPLAGGYISGKLGYVHASRVGILISALGMFCFCFNELYFMYLGLALFVVGNAFATPAIWCMVDHCYTKDSPMRESGFTLFYLFFNIGVVFGIFAGGYLATKFGFAVEFGLDTACLVLAFFLLQISAHKIIPVKDRSIAPQVNWSFPRLYGALLLSVLIGVPVSVLLFKDTTVNNILMLILLVGMVGVLFRIALQQPTILGRNRLIAFTCLAIIAIAFWTLYSLEPSFLSVFIQTNVDTHFLGFNIPATSFFAFDPVFVVLFGLIFSRVWIYLSLRNKNPSIAIKFAASLILIGLGFAYLAWMVTFHETTLMPAYDIVIAYAIFAAAELLVSPLGISMVGSLTPEGQEGLMMGFWQLSIGIGGVVAGYIAVAANLPQTTVALSVSNPLYFKSFLWVGLGTVAIGILVLFFVRKLRRLMSERPYTAPQI